MKRKVEEKLDGEKHSMCNHGVHWLRGKLIGKGSYGSFFLATPRKPTKDEHSHHMLNFREMMAVKSAKVSAFESIKHESDVLLEIKGCPFVIECLGEETTATDKGDMVYNFVYTIINRAYPASKQQHQEHQHRDMCHHHSDLQESHIEILCKPPTFTSL
ncbi:unnamed protein product [Prunus armeniaca]